MFFCYFPVPKYKRKSVFFSENKIFFYRLYRTQRRKVQKEGRTRKQRKNLFNYKSNHAWADNMQIIMQLGLTMAGCIIFCFIAGQAIDRWIGTKGIFITIFIIFGVIGGGVVVYRQIFEIIGETGSSEDSNNGTPKTD